MRIGDKMSSNEGLALMRDRRSNAGARMARLLEAEDEDDFYKTTYGGFNEEEDDFDYKSEASVSDETDSDIDINEDDELKSDVEAEGEAKTAKKLNSKAYKEPKKQSAEGQQLAVPKPKPEKQKLPVKTSLSDLSVEKKSLRKSTAEKSKSTEDCIREREAKAELLRQIAEKKKVAEVRRLTQEELLAEARITEQINLRSLETYQKLELEKKKARIHRQTHAGPVIRYHSVTVPLVEEVADAEINVEGEALDSDGRSRSTENCSRNFITFTDERLFHRYFPRKRLQPTTKHQCPITGLPAKYFDPVTRSPYANIKAFKLLREAYQQRLETLSAEKQAAEVSLENIKRRTRSQITPIS